MLLDLVLFLFVVFLIGICQALSWIYKTIFKRSKPLRPELKIEAEKPDGVLEHLEEEDSQDFMMLDEEW